jgi:hypothetical protein
MFAVLSAMKENIDLLTDQRGEADKASVVLTKAGITVNPAPEMTLKQMSATGAGFMINGVQVPSLEDHIKLIQDVRTLAGDVVNVRATLNALITQLKG